MNNATKWDHFQNSKTGNALIWTIGIVSIILMVVSCLRFDASMITVYRSVSTGKIVDIVDKDGNPVHDEELETRPSQVVYVK